jgi:hypothetical protein
MYSNAAGTAQLGNGTTATVNSGHFQIWVRSSGGASTAVLQATSTATVPMHVTVPRLKRKLGNPPLIRTTPGIRDRIASEVDSR